MPKPTVYGGGGASYVAAMRIVTLLIFAVLATAAAADVYRWTDDKGVVHYTDKPPAPGAKPLDLPPLQTFSASPAGSTAGAEPEAAPRPVTLRIVSPTNETTIRDPEGNVPVEVEVGLQPGQGLIYSLDGTAQNSSPTPSTAYLFSGLERGEHRITVAVIAENGKELSRASVTVFLMPPTVLRRRR